VPVVCSRECSGIFRALCESFDQESAKTNLLILQQFFDSGDETWTHFAKTELISGMSDGDENSLGGAVSLLIPVTLEDDRQGGFPLPCFPCRGRSFTLVSQPLALMTFSCEISHSHMRLSVANRKVSSARACACN
jgi:hypothetical protein